MPRAIPRQAIDPDLIKPTAMVGTAFLLTEKEVLNAMRCAALRRCKNYAAAAKQLGIARGSLHNWASVNGVNKNGERTSK